MLRFWIGDYAQVVLPIDSAQVLIDCPEQASFSWRGCDCCNDDRGLSLGADVYECTLQAAPGSDLARVAKGRGLDGVWERALCDKCVYEHHYGKGSYEG